MCGYCKGDGGVCIGELNGDGVQSPEDGMGKSTGEGEDGVES